MKPAELLERVEESENVIFHKFTITAKKYNDERIFAFFEGKEDSSYYYSRIIVFFKEVEIFVCNSKKNVISMYNRLYTSNKYNQYKLGFFIDRDFDEPNNNQNIYETKTYSIENFYCSIDFIKNILKSEFGLCSYEESYIRLLELFKTKQQEFNKSILLFNAWYYCYRTKTNNRTEYKNVSLDNKFPKKLLEISLNKPMIQSYGIDEIYKLYPDTPIFTTAEINKSKCELTDRDLNKSLRGKYQIQFIKEFLKFLIDDANKKENRKYLSSKTQFNFQDNLFISQLAQYADNPICLDNYLKNISSKSEFKIIA